MQSNDTTIPYGFCHCGCGQRTTIAKETRNGVRRGEPNRYIIRHGNRIENWRPRFWASIDVRGPDDCWPWLKSTDGHGYGTTVLGIREHGSNRAHRIAYWLTNGPLPPDKPHVLHRCDNPPCCNPAHHFAGDQDANNKDKAAKGRSYKGGFNRGQHYNQGSTHPEAKLTEAIVSEIRAIQRGGEPDRVIALRYAKVLGVRPQTIDKVLKGIGWKHVR